MKALIITGKLIPSIGNNANLFSKLFPFLFTKEDSVCILSETDFSEKNMQLPSEYCGFPINWAVRKKDSLKTKIIFPAIASILDRNVCSDAIQVLHAKDTAAVLRERFQFEIVFSTMEPFYAPLTASRLHNVYRVLYIMDPPISFVRDVVTPYRTRNMRRILSNHDVIVTTPFIRQALIDYSYGEFDSKIISVGFPMITPHNVTSHQVGDGKIRLLFCGWLYSDIRSPKYFLNIVSRLDERFEVTFMGKECEKLQERFSTETNASIITLPNQPYDVALQAMADADVLINIGNNVPVHMPSKTLEYINTGKPMVNFYKITDCPTLYYTKRYPLALNLFEEEKDIDAATAQFVQFCEENIGKTLNHDWIEAEYVDCTPQYIAQMIKDSLEKKYG